MKATRRIYGGVLAGAVSVVLLAGLGVLGTPGSDAEAPLKLRVAPEVRGEEVALITYAPEVPPVITRKHATKVIVELETIELESTLAHGVTYTYWTFNGRTPGPMIRVREGDQVEIRLRNHESSIAPHNIDLHAVTGPGGGAAATFTGRGQETVFSFAALNPGLYVYHCAVSPVGMHVANGMYGLILVEPAGGLPEVDREFYIVQSEFYTEGAHGDPGLQPFSYPKAVAEQADYVVFNGAVGAMTGDGALRATAGETVRMFVGNGGPNLISSFHVIGEVFDRVYGEAGSRVNQENVQTTLIPAGGAAMVELALEYPGTFILVDHSIFRAFDKGALGHLVVEGAPTVAQSRVFDGVVNGHGH